jgi:peptidoglycan/xylan/chitin deacetylase (PgdA/CDA1 family)
MDSIKQSLKSALLQGARLVGGIKNIGAPGALVLTYHSISQRGLPYTVDAQTFREQMTHLLEHGHPFFTVKELGRAMQNGRIPKNAVCVTFDDAFANTIPSLEWLIAQGGHATLFVVAAETGYNHWDGHDPTIPRLERMSWEQIKSLSDHLGIEIGSHTYNHRRLTDLGDGELFFELSDSKRTIEDRLELPIESLAYPFGDYNHNVIRAAENVGYRWGCTMQYSYVEGRIHPLMIPRMEPDTLTDLEDVARGRSHLFYRATGLTHKVKNQLMMLRDR